MYLFEKTKQHIHFFFLRNTHTHTLPVQHKHNCAIFFPVLGFSSSYNNFATIDKSFKFCLTILVCKMRSITVPTLEVWCDGFI